MKSITVRDLSVSVWDLLCKLVRPARRLKAPPRPRSIRLALEGLEDRTVPSPIVTGLSPNFGPVSGGTAVEIAGSGFTGTTAVDFGSDITEYQVVSDTQIDVRSPGESAGVVDVTVTTPSGTSPTSSADQFTYGTTTTTTLSSSADPSSFNQSVTFTATVSPNGSGTPTGTVTFMDGSTALGTGTLSGGLATFATSALAIGTHPVTAVYSGDSNFLGSTSSVLTQNVDSATAYIWTGADSNDWSTAGNWDVNGQPATVPPGASDDVLFSSVEGTELDCATNGEGTVSVNSITIDSSYTGTLTLNDDLDVGSGGFTMEGGATAQPGTTILVTGAAINWSGGVLNTSAILGTLSAVNDSIDITGASKTSGANFDLDNTNAYLKTTGNWTFNNNAGITLSNGSLFRWDSSTANIVTSGTGLFQNNGGTLLIDSTAQNPKVTSDLPYVNNAGSAILQVDFGTLVFDKAGSTSGVSVLQNSGHIILDDGTTLEVDKNLTMNGGDLSSAVHGTSSITGGDLYVHGGTMLVGGLNGDGTLNCSGNVTMDGGTYEADVNFQTNKYTLWKAKSFLIGTNATLQVDSQNVPQNLPKNMPFTILQATAQNGISGDFTTKNLAIGNTGKSYTTSVDQGKQNYTITTPAN